MSTPGHGAWPGNASQMALGSPTSSMCAKADIMPERIKTPTASGSRDLSPTKWKPQSSGHKAPGPRRGSEITAMCTPTCHSSHERARICS
eukprot:4409355-Pyramimonas_sp.AAC.1